MENIPVFIHGEKKKNSPASDKNVDTKRVDGIVVVHGLTEPQCSLAAADFPPGATRRDALPLLYSPLYLHSQLFSLKTQDDILVSFLHFILLPLLNPPRLLPVVSLWLNGLPQSPFQLRLSLIGSKLIRNEPLSPAETDSLTERAAAERVSEGGGDGRGGGG